MSVREESVHLPVDGVTLEGDLARVDDALGLVIFAHGSGSSRHSPRNRFVAQVLHEAGLATLLLDLLTTEEEQEDLRTAELRFDIELLARRVIGAVDWADADGRTSALRLGLFGSSTGAAAALVAAAARPELVLAVVSRGGRPDLAIPRLADVRAPTLLLVGGNDVPVIAMNQDALAALDCTKQLSVIPGATHLFAEPGALEEVARQACAWFGEYLERRTLRLPHGEPAIPGI